VTPPVSEKTGATCQRSPEMLHPLERDARLGGSWGIVRPGPWSHPLGCTLETEMTELEVLRLAGRQARAIALADGVPYRLSFAIATYRALLVLDHCERARRVNVIDSRLLGGTPPAPIQ
jgi:hypothetical protein